MPFRPSLLVAALIASSFLLAPHDPAQAKGSKNKSKDPAASEIVTELTEATTPLPGRQWQGTLRDLGASRPIHLRGVEGDGSVGLSVRQDELVTAARLRLTYTLSPALLPGLSHLKILLNDEVLQTVVAEKDKLGTPQTVELAIDPRYFTDYNQLRFQLIGHYTLECEMPSHSSLWASISNESRLDLTLRPLPLRNDLALLPAPFFDPRDNQPLKLPFVFGPQPGQGIIKASGSVASWLGMLAAYRGNQFQALENTLPRSHAIVIASNDQRPDFLKDLPPVQKPTLTLIAHPTQPGLKLLLVLGKDEAQTQLAADALVLGRSALSGSSMQVADFKAPPLRKAYDAPRWINTERPVKLAELVRNAGELQLRGTVLNDVVNISTRVAPDLFTWNAPGVPMNLLYRYTPTSLSDHGALNVSINDQFIKSYPLQSSEGSNAGKSSILLPLFDDGTLQSQSDLKIPAFLIGGDNQLQFAFQIPPSDLGRCRSVQPAELRAVLDPQSTIDLTGFGHYTAMPNLAAYANSGFPFTKYADLAQTSIVLPERPTTADLSLYLTALGRMGASTGYPGTRFKLLNSQQVQQAGDTDILVIAKGDPDGLLRQWGQHLPALIEAGKRSLRPMDRALDSLIELFSLESYVHDATPGGQAILEGNGPLGALSGFASPLSQGRTVMTLTGTDDASLEAIGLGLSDAGKIRRLRGDLGLFRGDAVESFRVNPVYYVGDLSWWRQLWFYLHTHPVLLALLGLSAGLMLTFMAYVALRAMARRRLENQHD